MKTLRYFLAAYPARCLAVLGWLLVAGATEGLGLSTLLPLLSVATGSGVARERLRGAGRARARGARHSRRIPGPLFAIVIGALWIKAILMLLSKRQVGYAVARIATDLRLRLLRALLAARWSFSSRQPAGRAANSMATEADRASYAFEYLALIASYSVETTVYVAIAFAVSWRGTLLAGGAAALMLLLLHFLVRMAHRAGRKQTALLDSLLTRTTDTLGAVKLLKATGARGRGRAAARRRHRAPEPPAPAPRARARVAARAPGARGRHAARAGPVRRAAHLRDPALQHARARPRVHARAHAGRVDPGQVPGDDQRDERALGDRCADPRGRSRARAVAAATAA